MQDPYSQQMSMAIVEEKNSRLVELVIGAVTASEYMLGKIASAGQNGQFRTPRHIIKLMVDMTAPTPKDVICDPACGTAGFLIAASEHLVEHHKDSI